MIYSLVKSDNGSVRCTVCASVCDVRLAHYIRRTEYLSKFASLQISDAFKKNFGKIPALCTQFSYNSRHELGA